MSRFCLAAPHAAVAKIVNLFIQPDAPECFAKHCSGKGTFHFIYSAAHALLEARAVSCLRRAIHFQALGKKNPDVPQTMHVLVD